MGNLSIDTGYNPFAGGASTSWGQYSTQGTQAVGGAKTGGGLTSTQSELDEVSSIGASKRAGFENGLGGTNNPDDHKLFLAA